MIWENCLTSHKMGSIGASPGKSGQTGDYGVGTELTLSMRYGSRKCQHALVFGETILTKKVSCVTVFPIVLYRGRIA